jgi:hypothetical protein
MKEAWKWIGSIGVLLVGVAFVMLARNYETKRQIAPVDRFGPDIILADVPKDNLRRCEVDVPAAALWKQDSRRLRDSIPGKSAYRVPRKTEVYAPKVAHWVYGEGAKPHRLARVQLVSGVGLDSWIMDLGELKCAGTTEKR